jgi:hypothetical protein
MNIANPNKKFENQNKNPGKPNRISDKKRNVCFDIQDFPAVFRIFCWEYIICGEKKRFLNKEQFMPVKSNLFWRIKA